MSTGQFDTNYSQELNPGHISISFKSSTSFHCMN